MAFAKRRGLWPAILVVIVLVNTVVYYAYVSKTGDTEVSLYETHEAQYQTQPWQHIAETETDLNHDVGTVEDDANNLRLPNGNWSNDDTVKLLFDYTGTENLKGEKWTVASIYDDIFGKHSPQSVLSSLSFSERCDLYFTNLFLRNVDWMVDPKEDITGKWREQKDFDDFRKHKDAKQEFINRKKLDLKHEDLDENDDEYIVFAVKYYEEEMARVGLHEQRMHDVLSTVRIFNRCYITPDDAPQRRASDAFVANQKTFMSKNKMSQKFKPNAKDSRLDLNTIESVTKIERKVFPFLSMEFPMYESWQGKQSYKPPKFKEILKGSDYAAVFAASDPESAQGRGSKPLPKSKFGDSGVWLNKFKNAMNGRGIVMSISDGHVEDTIKLIHLLRALDNTLPIQIVYFDNLDSRSKRLLVNAAREKMIVPPDSYHLVDPSMFGPNYLSYKNERGDLVGLRPQELWFVNVRPAIDKEYRGKFGSYGNKFLATMFNSFAEFMIIDADTVLTKPPQYFFEMDEYKAKGAYFWQDRAAAGRHLSDGQFFDKVSPSVVDQVMFGIPILSNHTLNSSYFRGMSHVMESGLVTIDRNRHFTSVIMGAILNNYGMSRDRSYGDKELFWLGFSMNGDESYAWNKFRAGSLGQVTPPEYNLKDYTKPPEPSNYRKSKEICAAHPAHLSGQDRQLAWFNSGFQTCSKVGRISSEGDFNRGSRFKWISNLKDFKVFYEGPLRIEAIVVPPHLDPQDQRHPNDEGEESGNGWFWERGYCLSYMWCAYSQAGGKSWSDGKETDNTVYGEYVEVDPATQALYRYLGDTWFGNE
ncbi:putative alpha-1,3-mannosyltransferase Mnn1p [Diutina catenulata]